MEEEDHFHNPNTEQPSQTPFLDHQINSAESINVNITQQLKDCQFQKALESMELELISQQKKFGENSIHNVPLLNLMSEISISLGRYSVASKISDRCEQILKDYKEDRDMSPLLAKHYQNAALLHEANLEYNQALETINKAQTIHLKLYPVESPKNIDIHRVKATILRALKTYHKELEEILNSVDIVKKSTDVIEPNIIALVYNTLGTLHRVMRNNDRARRYHKKALEICEKSGYNSHLEVAKAHVGIGLTLTGQEVYNHAIAALKCFQDVHPERISAYLMLADFYKQAKSNSDVQKYTQLAVQEGEKVYGKGSFKAREVCLRAARIAQSGQLAKDLVKSILEILIENKSQEELKFLCAQICEASLISKNVDLFDNVYEIAKQVYGPVSLWIAEINEMMAVSLSKKKEVKDSLIWAKRSIKILKEILGDDHLSVAAMYILVAKRYYSKKSWKISTKYIELALTIRLSFYVEVHPFIVQTYMFLADSYQFQKEHQKSIQIHRKILELQEKLGDPEIYETYETIARLYGNGEVSDLKNASYYYRKSYQMARVKLGIKDSRTVDTREFSEFCDEEIATLKVYQKSFI